MLQQRASKTNECCENVAKTFVKGGEKEEKEKLIYFRNVFLLKNPKLKKGRKMFSLLVWLSLAALMTGI